MNRQCAAWILPLVLAVSACAQNAVPEPFPQAAVDALVERFNAHDAAGVASFYTEDAVMLPPDAEPVTGRAAIQEFFARTNAPGTAPVEFATVETRVFGDHAWRMGTFRIEGGPPDAPTNGQFVELWKKVDGAWLLHRDIWNAYAPPPADWPEPAATPDQTPEDAVSDEPA
jgi:uncharacterized protein (TIGR02246 family)